MSAIPRTMAVPAEAPQSTGSKYRALIWFSLLFVASYAVVLARLGKDWIDDPNMSHGLFVPLLVGYLVWQDREALIAAKVTHSVFGFFLMVLGGALLCIGPPGLDTFSFATRIALVLSLVGSVLYLRGGATMRILLYPLLLLLLMFPLPGFILERLTFPLQIIASQLAEHALDLLGYSVLREGNILRLPHETLSVAEACSGLRSLLALTFLSQAYVCLFDQRRWMRPVMAIVVLPIAVLANGARIVASAIAGTFNPEWAEGKVHESTGWVVFVVAFVCIVGAHFFIGKTGRWLQHRQTV